MKCISWETADLMMKTAALIFCRCFVPDGEEPSVEEVIEFARSVFTELCELEEIEEVEVPEDKVDDEEDPCEDCEDDCDNCCYNDEMEEDGERNGYIVLDDLDNLFHHLLFGGGSN